MSLTNSSLKAAVVGLGRIGSLLEEDPLREKPCTHAGAIAAVPGLRLCAGADTDEERRHLFAKKWSVPVYADAETMLHNEKPHILHIATHPDSHWYYCSLAARCGVSTVVSEKPLADTLWAAKKIARLHESGKITILVNHERRYAADYAEAKSILAARSLGPLVGVKGTLYMGKTRRLVDVLWHDGTHLADAAMFLTGGMLKHRKTSGNLTHEAPGTAYLAGTLENTVAVSGVSPAAVSGVSSAAVPPTAGTAVPKGIPFLLELGAGRDHLVFELEFSCERGKLKIGNRIFEVWKSRESPYAEGFISLEKIREGFSGPTGYFSNMAADALACAEARLSGIDRTPLSAASDGLRVIRYLRSIGAWR